MKKLAKLLKNLVIQNQTRETKKADLSIEIREDTILRLPELPMEIMVEIILRLPVKSVVRFKCVSHLWKKTISDPNFGTKHFRNQKQPQLQSLKLLLQEQGKCSFYSVAPLQGKAKAVKVGGNLILKRRNMGVVFSVFGSCNGLILIGAHNEEELILCIWNPSTGENKILPEHVCLHPHLTSTYGFGHDPLTDDYKVLCLEQRGIYSTFDLYTTCSNSWRRVGEIILLEDPRYRYPMVLANSKLFCLTSDLCTPKVVSFNLETENISLLESPGAGRLTILDLCPLNGNLCASTLSGLWVMNDDVIEASWVKISDSKRFPLHVAENGVSLIYEKDASLPTAIGVYDINKEKERLLNIRNAPRLFKSTVYVETLISPNAHQCSPLF